MASHLEEEAAHLRGFIVVEDHERAMVARTRQGASVTLASMQLWTGMNLCRVTPRFPEHTRQEERMTRVNDFAAAADVVVAVVDVVEILCGGG